MNTANGQEDICITFNGPSWEFNVRPYGFGQWYNKMDVWK